MSDAALKQALSGALLALRITLGLFLLQWGVEKFVVPQNTVAIWGYFYGLGPPSMARRWRCIQSASSCPGASSSILGPSLRTTSSSPACRCWAP